MPRLFLEGLLNCVTHNGTGSNNHTPSSGRAGQSPANERNTQSGRPDAIPVAIRYAAPWNS